MGWVMIENENRDGKGSVRQVLWNRAAANIGLEGITVTMKYREKTKGQDGSLGLDSECALLWKDKPVQGLPDVEGGKEDVP